MTLKGGNTELAGSRVGRSAAPMDPRTSHEAEHSDAIEIADQLADLWLLAVRRR